MRITSSQSDGVRIALIVTEALAVVFLLLGCAKSSPSGPTVPPCDASFYVYPPPPATGLAAMTVYKVGNGTYGVFPNNCALCTFDFGDGATAVGSPASHTYRSAGQFTVTFSPRSPECQFPTTKQVVIKSMAGTWQGTIGTSPVTTFTLVLAQSEDIVTGTYTDDRSGAGSFSRLVIGDGRNPTDASNWTVPWFSVNISQGARQFYINAGAVGGLDSFTGTCVYYDTSTSAPMTMTRQ